MINDAMNCGKAVIATTAVGCASGKINNGVNGSVVPEKRQHSVISGHERRAR